MRDYMTYLKEERPELYEKILKKRHAVSIKMTNKVDPEVAHPDHYTVGGIETLEVLKAKLSKEKFEGYLEGNVLKYVTRSAYKGKRVQDLAKARFYIDRLIKEIED